ncbi:thiosulfate oxidation carrier protein SoxY [Sedimenticola sp.]|uniref:thiosulfate oxidation carrier protein SoxY n=1 Tax=Sedimenticola sp. TaxID=1940285 RepID=UPI003D11337E
MKTDLKRRMLLKGTVASSAIGIAIGAGLLTPKAVMAAWPKAAFTAKDIPGALTALMGAESADKSGEINIKAPDIAENGAVVPVTVASTLANIESIAIIAANNPVPLIANFNLQEGAEGFVSTRIKMGKSGDVIAVVKSGGKLYKTSKEVKVTIGGCGG